MKKLGLISILLLSGCGIFGPSYSGQTTADWLLKSDTESTIRLYFRAINNCGIEKIHTEINSIPSAGNVNETWTVTGCNITNVFNVKYVSDGHGGTYFRVSKK
ncbi:hypothetical protein [Histophilus somni]|uniref:Lipoprotein n=1 Tax=Histophilus somni TaxID=731 RepID=A0A9Q6YZT5_HISSO|nr:hypothetical protein [Histophilus somni]ARU65345.1 hypothetical protein BTV18_07475 [Histophilus somni]ARU67212.1 hypothetical protein BTV19_07905 [Histophilus somni]ARU69089.1 hypothetical protein BTV16_07915 [Histophilus somni]ARU70967.1 hypothetical protein BTV20_07915 [Histophilus somni]ARU72839.1 hypothetical protein BTV17_07895 [Histophilus somni]